MPDARYELPPPRLGRWLDRWAAAHPDGLRTTVTADAVTFTAAAGARVECRPLIAGLDAADHDGFAPAPLLEHVTRVRVVGVLLVRLGAHAVAVFEGDALVASKVSRRLVHGRNRAGGQSQRRFERRREGQARDSLQAAADLAARLLLPLAGRLDAVVAGGDARATGEVLADRRLAPLAALAAQRVLDVPEPRLEVVRGLPPRLRSTVVIANEGG